MKITIHHNYEYLLGDIKDIVEGNYVAKKVFCHNRNVVEMVNLQGSPFVVKRYKEPNWLNRVVYTWLRKSKARRAYEYALRLLDEGVETPAPVAYIEIKRGRLFSVGYFISEYLPYNLLKDAPALLAGEDARRLTRDFLDFTASLHSKGILPGDFNGSNIFYRYDEESGCYRFALTDVNRMRFGKVPTTSEAMRSFEQLGVPLEGLYMFANNYCSRQESDVEYTIFIYLLHRMRSRVKSAFKRRLKART